MKLQHRPHPDHPRRQPAAARRPVRDDARPDGRQAGRRKGLRRARAQGGRGQRAGSRWTPASTSSATARWASRASSPTRRSGSTAWKSARARGQARSPTSRETTRFPGILPVGGGGAGQRPPPPRADGLRRADQIQGTRPAQDRPRQSEGRAEGRRRRRGFRAGHRAVEHRDARRRTSIIRPTRIMCSPSPRRCARNTRRSSTPASCCRSTIRFSSPITSRART